VTDREIAPPGPGEVQVAVAYVGICGTDLHLFHGAMDGRVQPGRVIGHEMSGTVAAVGPDVAGWSPGSKVTVIPVVSCLDCSACLAGNAHVCHRLSFLGIDADGAMCERWNVPAASLVALPQECELRVAALVEPTAVAVHDVRRSVVQPGERTLVVGGGPIGLLIATVASERGADVLLLEPDPLRRAAAQAARLRVRDPAAPDLVEEMLSWTDGAGPAVAFEVSGSQAGMDTAVAHLAVRGRLVVVAIHPEPRTVNLHRFFWRELTLHGARLYERADFEEAVRLIAVGAIPADVLITGCEPMDRVQQAIESLEDGQGAVKVLVDCRGSAR
jgi:2-desacetyl-2-hydroxyethyl bacteriochlorophyllide A dehydrogenase